MKHLKHRLIALGLALATLGLASCNNSEAPIQSLEESEVAELAQVALQSHAGGLMDNLGVVVTHLMAAAEDGEPCNTTLNHTLEEAFSAGITRASYTANLTYELSCGMASMPQSALLASTSHVFFNSSNVASNDDATLTTEVTGLQPSAPALVLGAGYSRFGTQTLAATAMHGQKEVTSTLSVTLTQLNITKDSLEIMAGTGTFSIGGTTEEGAFEYTGNLVFNGTGTATLTLNEGAFDIIL